MFDFNTLAADASDTTLLAAVKANPYVHSMIAQRASALHDQMVRSNEMVGRAFLDAEWRRLIAAYQAHIRAANHQRHRSVSPSQSRELEHRVAALRAALELDKRLNEIRAMSVDELKIADARLQLAKLRA